MASNGDPYVLNVQKWVNDTFRGEKGYTEITENGIVSYTTIYALLHGLQIRLNVGSTADNFGNGTINAFNNYVKSHPIQQQSDDDDSTNDIYGIIQGALICKGYDIGSPVPTCRFRGGTGAAIKKLKRDAGLTDETTVVTLNIMKALMSMDYFFTYKTDSFSKNVRTIQQYLNRNYESYIGIRPCDGIYGRSTNGALIYGIQAEEKLPIGTANGNFGKTTKATCPTIPYDAIEKDYNGSTYSENSISNFVKLARMALYVNGFEEAGGFTTSGEYNESLKNVIKNFQQHYGLSVNGKLDLKTWLSLLISCGDTSRSAVGCDCITIITEDNIDVLKHNGIKYIGRYLSKTINGTDYSLSNAEVRLLYKNGIRLFPIFQGAANRVSYFTIEQAKLDASNAVKHLKRLNIQFGAIVYFAVDCDVMDYQITNSILPYFKQLYFSFIGESLGQYRLGIYGARNVCSRVCNAGYACSSFVSDMSTGFSGNLGFSIPNNWAFDQFATIKIYNSDKTKFIEIDKDGVSGRDIATSQEYFWTERDTDELVEIKFSCVLVNRAGTSLSVYESKEHIDLPLPTVGPNYKTSGKKIGEIKPNEFYIFYGIPNTSIDNVHRVLFNDGKEIKTGYVTGTYVGDTISTTFDDNFKQSPKDHEPYSRLKYNPDTHEYTINSKREPNIITINRPVPYFSSNGTYEGILNKGDVISIDYNRMNNVGETRPWCYRVNLITKTDGNVLYDKYVSTGLEYGSSGSGKAWY